MKELTAEVLHFLKKQNFVIVATVDDNGIPHSSCKGMVDIDPQGKIYLLDLYTGHTYNNIKKRPQVNISAVDEHKFTGFCLKGEAHIVKEEELSEDIRKMWQDKIASRVSHRIIKKIHGEKGHPAHPEILMPHPKYMIAMDVFDVIDLTPGHLK
jgi:general stress protein 26